MRNTLITLFICLLATFLPVCASADTGAAICFEEAMRNANADGTPKILYTGQSKITMNMRSQADKESPSLGSLMSEFTMSGGIMSIISRRLLTVSLLMVLFPTVLLP